MSYLRKLSCHHLYEILALSTDKRSAKCTLRVNYHVLSIWQLKAMLIFLNLLLSSAISQPRDWEGCWGKVTVLSLTLKVNAYTFYINNCKISRGWCRSLLSFLIARGRMLPYFLLHSSATSVDSQKVILMLPAQQGLCYKGVSHCQPA